MTASRFINAPRGSALIVRIEWRSMPEPNSGCWLWLGASNASGYGHLKVGNAVKKAHVCSWLAHRGEIPEGLHVCHKCDVRLCVNPDHLWLGTHADNMADMVVKGRSRRSDGEHNNSCKLSKDEVAAIISSPLPPKEAAPLYGISRGYVSMLRCGHSRSGKRANPFRDYGIA